MLFSPGLYTLTCYDSNGDGWHGGSVNFMGWTYCFDFDVGSMESHVFVLEDVPDLCDDKFIIYVQLITEVHDYEQSWEITQHCQGSHVTLGVQCCLEPSFKWIHVAV
eukprot:UN01695